MKYPRKVIAQTWKKITIDYISPCYKHSHSIKLLLLLTIAVLQNHEWRYRIGKLRNS